MNLNRISAIREKTKKLGVVLITDLPNIYYLVGFTGSSGALLITHKKTLFFTDFRYKEQSAREIKSAETIITKDSLFEELAAHSALKSIKTLGFESQIAYSTYKLLKKALKGKKLVPLKDKIETMRMLKDESEINTIKKASRISEQAFRHILPLVKPGAIERDIALEFDYQVRKNGGEGVSFPTIVASGPSAALPHARTSSRKLKNGDTVVIDFGAIYNHYCSDTTRTLILGDNPKAYKIYKIVQSAQKTAIKAIKIGIPLSKLDAVARNIIRKAGYGEYFGHSLGHGVGLNVHEAPRVSKKSKDKVIPGMVFTIEPAIYLPNLGGVRIEDMVLVTDKGIELITRSPYEKF